ncbi:hypothetical protein [Mucilaginibacter ginsenosidivorax]|uniref:Transmembrane protein n=1 Tax=Mucilaginibacter ginsenosidivorax TaxID=862126 RepID=A0A5B8W8Q2_9SPHI|nr:hypothetical protein [Mucilaginibacter ginsenosidivorax]QEC79335.1 hypothetical protein FSB76_26550 [Mucilaginibacter ginsenosidivorax]
MASEEYLNRQINKQKYGGGASDFDIVLDHEQRQKLNVYKTYYPNTTTKNINQSANTNANYHYVEIDTRSKLIVYGAIGVFVVLFLAVSWLIDWIGSSPFSKLDSGETFVFVSAIICFIACIVQYCRIIFWDHLNDRNENYRNSYSFIMFGVFLVSIVIIALFIIWAVQIRQEHLG